jgi:NitT/TauT family transport system permease protein
LVLLPLIAAWQVLSWRTRNVALASPIATAARLADLIGTAAFWGHAAETLAAALAALLVSGVAGLALGVALGAHRFSGEVAEPLLIGFYTLPKVTLYPLVLTLFGLGMPAKVAFGAIHGLVPVALFAMNAIRAMPPVLLRTARVFQLSPAATVRTVILPAVLPELATGLRVGASLTLLGVLIGEMFASQRGLGFLIANAIGLNDTATILAVTLLVAAVAVATNAALLAVEHRLRHPA